MDARAGRRNRCQDGESEVGMEEGRSKIEGEKKVGRGRRKQEGETDRRTKAQGG